MATEAESYGMCPLITDGALYGRGMKHTVPDEYFESNLVEYERKLYVQCKEAREELDESERFTSSVPFRVVEARPKVFPSNRIVEHIQGKWPGTLPLPGWQPGTSCVYLFYKDYTHGEFCSVMRSLYKRDVRFAFVIIRRGDGLPAGLLLREVYAAADCVARDAEDLTRDLVYTKPDVAGLRAAEERLFAARAAVDVARRQLDGHADYCREGFEAYCDAHGMPHREIERMTATYHEDFKRRVARAVMTNIHLDRACVGEDAEVLMPALLDGLRATQ